MSRCTPLLCVVLSACWVGAYADYSVTAERSDEVSLVADEERWFEVQAVHEVNFEELEDSPANADLRDGGTGRMTLRVTRVSGDGELQAEMLYWAGLQVFENGPPRQGGFVVFTDDDVATLTHDLAFIGGSKSGLGDGAPLNGSPGSDPVPALGLRLVTRGDAEWDVRVDTEVTYTRSYPEKYWEVTGGTLDLFWVPSSREEVGWVPQLDAPPTTETTGPVPQTWSGAVVDLHGDGIGAVELCNDDEEACTTTDDGGGFSLELTEPDQEGFPLRDFVMRADGYPTTVATWFAFAGGPIPGVTFVMMDDEQRAAVHAAAGTTPDPDRGDVLVRIATTSLEPQAGVALVRHGGAGPLVALDLDDDTAGASPVSGASGVMVIPNVPVGRFGVAGLAPWICNPQGGYPGETGRSDVYVRAGAVSEVGVVCY